MRRLLKLFVFFVVAGAFAAGSVVFGGDALLVSTCRVAAVAAFGLGFA